VGSSDFQLVQSKESGRKLYEEVIIKSQQWADANQLMYVVGATQADKMKEIRALAQDYFFLVPGIGAQGGDLKMVSRNGMNEQCGLLVNSSRSIIYASSERDFANAAQKESARISNEMKSYLDKFL
jgi:orotidine-5'-phosphate decarboxylase